MAGGAISKPHLLRANFKNLPFWGPITEGTLILLVFSAPPDLHPQRWKPVWRCVPPKPLDWTQRCTRSNGVGGWFGTKKILARGVYHPPCTLLIEPILTLVRIYPCQGDRGQQRKKYHQVSKRNPNSIRYPEIINASHSWLFSRVTANNKHTQLTWQSAKCLRWCQQWRWNIRWP
jgi:hypothetical protein